MRVVLTFTRSCSADWCEFAVVLINEHCQSEVSEQQTPERKTFMKLFPRRPSLICIRMSLMSEFDAHPVKCFEHSGFDLPPEGQRKKIEIRGPEPRPQKRPHFTTKNVGTHSGCPSFGRDFVSNFGPRNGAHVSGTGQGPPEYS